VLTILFDRGNRDSDTKKNCSRRLHRSYSTLILANYYSKPKPRKRTVPKSPQVFAFYMFMNRTSGELLHIIVYRHLVRIYIDLSDIIAKGLLPEPVIIQCHRYSSRPNQTTATKRHRIICSRTSYNSVLSLSLNPITTPITIIPIIELCNRQVAASYFSV